ncbi:MULTISPECIES: outer membrane beta-barrel protein [Acidobacterium]|uniref:Outer membrane protein beta-barrel domain-containing protein n=1 Tax=Acidobacterium capsulatum (strain ATCC 51196 / DSM 11244 / BCRC 80197 / JCM 7670 / NBRC 15755 / NCIMB 13165 / 161) TaxID=240015 RepID=C1F7B6_ACIC5|nr:MULTISPECIES: outer membrane beta-barrel protein [Acidobacterium]ACO32666.1 hypothetical protein ACP_1672 [Acidobacterium capsulatum ATCC 51196]HCT61049.1 hypothetical protein [Acidobacterium sp.]
MLAICRTLPVSLRRVSAVAAALAVAGALSLPAFAASPATSSSSSDGYSSSAAYTRGLNIDNLVGNTLADAPAGQYGSNGGGQYGAQYPNYQSRWSKLAFEAGGGFTAPIGNDTHGYNTWGYNFRVGAGWNFSKRLGVLVEYTFDRTKIPGSTLSYLSNESGIYPLYGNINNWSFTIDPIIYQPFTKTTGAYITGGGGFYRKVTNFSTPVPFTGCDFYYGCYYGYAAQTVAHSSSNQGGLNIGAGLYWKAFGEDSNAKLYMEARYVWINSPNASRADPYGSGTEGLIPVTFGVRF